MPLIPYKINKIIKNNTNEHPKLKTNRTEVDLRSTSCIYIYFN